MSDLSLSKGVLRRALALPLVVLLFLVAGFVSAPGVGVPVASAQGGMDVSILTPSFTDLPLSVMPGEEFVIGAATAPGARCVGTLQFRDHSAIELESQAAPAGACAWTVATPPTVRPSTGIVRIVLSKGGQTWNLTGTLWVGVVGEGR